MSHHTHPHNPHHETGISDEAAIEGHDLIQHAEDEERALHGDDGSLGATEEPRQTSRTTQKKTGELGGSSHEASGGAGAGAEHKQSRMDKVKEAMHLKK